MRQSILLSLASLVAIGAITACNSNESGRQPAANLFVGADGAQRISASALHELWESGQVYVVDTRNDAMFKTGHIPGAVVITQNEIVTKSNILPRDKMIVTYCT